MGAETTAKVASVSDVKTDATTGVITGTLILTNALLGASAGEQLIIKVEGAEAAAQTESLEGQTGPTGASGEAGTTSYEVTADVFVSLTGTKKLVQFGVPEGITFDADALKDAVVVLG